MRAFCARRRACSRLQPSTNSSTRKNWSPDLPRSSTCTRLLWFRRRCDVGLVHQHAHEGGIRRQGRENALQHHLLLKTLGAELQGQKNLCHTPVSDLVDDVVPDRPRHRAEDTREPL